VNSQVTARDELRQLIWQLIVDAWQENGVRLQARQDQPAEGGRDCQPLPMAHPAMLGCPRPSLASETA